MMRRAGSVERDIIIRQRVIKDMDSKNWVVLVREQLHKYGQPSSFTVIDPPLKKEQ